MRDFVCSICTVEVIALLQLKPVLVDIEEDTFNIDCDEILKAITSKTKAIIPVHLFENNQPSLQEGFLRLEDQMKVQGLQLTGQKSDPGEDRYQQNRYEDGGLKDNADGADGSAEGGGPGIGAYVGAAGTALSLGKMAFGNPGIDTSGATAPEEIPSKGSAALSGAMQGASAGMAFGPWGAARTPRRGVKLECAVSAENAVKAERIHV